MQRVKFDKTTDDGRYRKGETVSFDDATAETLVSKRLASKVEGPISVEDPEPGEEMRRVEFTRPVNDSGKLIHTAGERCFLKKSIADRFIENGVAKAFDIPRVGEGQYENKMVKQGAVRQKAS